MKTLFTSILMMLFALTAWPNEPQFKHFILIKDESTINTIRPNYISKPDLSNRPFQLAHRSRTFGPKVLRQNYPALFNKVENILTKGATLIYQLTYDVNSNIIDRFFFCSPDVIPYLTDEMLLEIDNTFKDIEIGRVENDMGKDDPNAYGRVIIYFVGGGSRSVKE